MEQLLEQDRRIVLTSGGEPVAVICTPGHYDEMLNIIEALRDLISVYECTGYSTALQKLITDLGLRPHEPNYQVR